MKIALVLGSGGARGYAHIGVIEELRRRGHEIVTIAGTSMGAVIGSLEAAGKLDEFADWATGLTHLEVMKYYDIAFRSPGVIKADRIMDTIIDMTGEVNIEDLPIPFTAVATDLVNTREVWFQSGPLRRALHASVAIPTFISPVQDGGRTLADGGLVNPVPVEPTLAVRSDMTIAVSLTGKARSHVQAGPDDVGDVSGQDSKILDWVRRSRIADSPGVRSLFRKDQSTEHLPEGLTTAGVINLSLETMQSMIERYRAATHPVDVRLAIPALVCGTLDFHRAADVIETGRQIAIEAFDDLGL